MLHISNKPMLKIQNDALNNAVLEELDFSVLNLLQEDGRMSFTIMAEKLGVSISTVATRVTDNNDCCNISHLSERPTCMHQNNVAFAK